MANWPKGQGDIMNINSLFDIANLKSVKTSQSEKWSAINCLINSLDIDQLSVDQVLALKVLYKSALPPLPKKPKNDWDHLAKICPKNDVRYYLNYIYASSGKVTCTDGSILMQYESQNIDNGFYCAKTKKKIDVDATYPNVDKVIGKPDWIGTSRPMLIKGEEIHTIGGKPVRVYQIGGNKYNADYIDKALNFIGVDEFDHECNTASPLKLKYKDKLALIMPMRV